MARVRAALSALNLDTEIREFDVTTRTSADAAAAIGCSVGQIAKSLIFRGRTSSRPVLVIASGANRVDEEKIGANLGEKIAKADADFVRAHTGFAIGGVAPIGHTASVRVLIDADLGLYDEIWASAGSPNSVFRLKPADLARITGGSVVDLKL